MNSLNRLVNKDSVTEAIDDFFLVLVGTIKERLILVITKDIIVIDVILCKSYLIENELIIISNSSLNSFVRLNFISI